MFRINRTLLIIFTVLTVTLGIAILARLFMYSWETAREAQPLINAPALIEPTSTLVYTTTSILHTTLTAEKYNELNNILTALVSSASPREALTELGHLMKTDRAVLRSCHGLVHEIGHAAYEKYGNFQKAMEFQDDVCGAGYLHGIIESSFANVTDVLATAQNLCAGFSATTSGKCYHGVGHGFMYYMDNDVSKSIGYCDSYKKLDAKIRCAEGVYMENFGTEDLHTSIYLNPKDPLYPCAEQPPMYKPVCYFYAPLYYLNLHVDAYAEALAWCTGAEDYALACARGVGSRTMKQNIEDPKLVERICESQKKFTAGCLDGMVSYHLVNFASGPITWEMCGTLKEENQPACFNSVEKRHEEFPR